MSNLSWVLNSASASQSYGSQCQLTSADTRVDLNIAGGALMGATESTEAGAQQQQDKPAVVPSALVLCGPSGVGKGTVISRLMHDEQHFGFSCSHTTRKPRPGEEVRPRLCSWRISLEAGFLPLLGRCTMIWMPAGAGSNILPVL